MAISTDIQSPGEVRLLACITHMFRPDRLGYLSDALASLYNLGTAQLDVVIFTDTIIQDDLSIIERLISKFISPHMSILISSHPEVKDTPKRLPWVHKSLFQQKHLEASSIYTHYLYIEDDMLFSHGNLAYFLMFRSSLRPFGLLPGMLRYEYNDIDHDIFTVDQQGRQGFLHKSRVLCRGVELLNLDEPYMAMFMLDRELMDEYLVSRSFDFESSAGVVPWGDLERASMGLTWENTPPTFQSRCVIPLKKGTATPDAMCWVKHLPGNYTNDYRPTPNFIIGKTRMDEIFTDFDRQDRPAPYISCAGCEDISEPSMSFMGEIYPSARYQRPIPYTEASGPFKDQLDQIYGDVNRTHTSIQRSILVSFKTAYLFGPVVYVQSNEELALLFETYRPNDRRFVTAPHPAIIINTSLRYEASPGSCKIFIGSAGSFNYGHWLVDDLPRLKAVHVLRARFPDCEIKVLFSALGNLIDSIRKESAEKYLGAIGNYSIEFLDCKVPYKIQDLFYVSPVSLHPATKSPAAVNWISEQVVSMEARPPHGGDYVERVFVTRRPPDSRTLLNHQEVADFLSSHGFSTADMNGLNFSQQVAIFKRAKIVVGCMGAAMTNTILCESPITIVMVAPEGWVEPFYWDLAAVRGDRYAACYGEPDNKTIAANASSYSIDVAKLASLMDRLGLLEQDAART